MQQKFFCNKKNKKTICSQYYNRDKSQSEILNFKKERFAMSNNKENQNKDNKNNKNENKNENKNNK